MTKTFVLLFLEDLTVKTYSSLSAIFDDYSSEYLETSLSAMQKKKLLRFPFQNKKIKIGLSMTKSTGDIRREKEELKEISTQEWLFLSDVLNEILEYSEMGTEELIECLDADSFDCKAKKYNIDLEHLIKYIRGLSSVELIYQRVKKIWENSEPIEKRKMSYIEYEKMKENPQYLKRLDKDYNSLPEIFRKRIDRFRENNPKFRIKYEEAELYSCKEAVKIASALNSKEDVIRFSTLEYEAQKEMVPDLSHGHSGNSFGHATLLAYLYLSDDSELIIKANGVLAPLVGSAEYEKK